MMTVVIRGRRRRRQPLIDYPSPRTWCIGAERYYCRMWTPETEAGSAKPGRGGRRKRRRARVRNPLAEKLRALLAASGQRWFILPPGATVHMLEPRPVLGRRERRRRAKLRRRRARSEARSSARAFLLAMPAFYRPPCPRNMWREISRVAQRKTEQRRAEERRAARRTNEMTRALLEVGTRPRPIEIQTVRYPKPTPGS